MNCKHCNTQLFQPPLPPKSQETEPAEPTAEQLAYDFKLCPDCFQDHARHEELHKALKELQLVNGLILEELKKLNAKK